MVSDKLDRLRTILEEQGINPALLDIIDEYRWEIEQWVADLELRNEELSYHFNRHRERADRLQIYIMMMQYHLNGGQVHHWLNRAKPERYFDRNPNVLKIVRENIAWVRRHFKREKETIAISADEMARYREVSRLFRESQKISKNYGKQAKAAVHTGRERLLQDIDQDRYARQSDETAKISA